jgi:phosphoglycerate dehydrogenase-like enzyme
MGKQRPHVLLVFNQQARDRHLSPGQMERLESLATWSWLPCSGGGIRDDSGNPAQIGTLSQQLHDVDALIVCRGAPRIDGPLMDGAPRLRFIGELEGDRFASRIDVEAAWQRGIRTVDTTNGSSYPVAEWALALILVSLRNGGAQYRRLIGGDTVRRPEQVVQAGGILTGKRVGLIGCGHMGRRLIQLLRPFQVDIWTYDPYLAPEIPEILGVTLTGLDNLLGRCDVVVCLAPLTPATRGLIGRRELNLIRSGSVLVNVSRGPIIDSTALLERLRRGDIRAGLDVYDPEPIPPDSEILRLPNVFLSPHIGGITGDAHPHFFRLMVDELERFFQGHHTYFDLTPRSLANRRGEPFHAR